MSTYLIQHTTTDQNGSCCAICDFPREKGMTESRRFQSQSLAYLSRTFKSSYTSFTAKYTKFHCCLASYNKIHDLDRYIKHISTYPNKTYRLTKKAVN